MKLHALKFGFACAISAALLWILCSVLVMIMPSIMLSISGDMLHMQLQEMGWHITMIGIVKGLVAWSVSAGITGWFLSIIYNLLLAK